MMAVACRSILFLKLCGFIVCILSSFRPMLVTKNGQ